MQNNIVTINEFQLFRCLDPRHLYCYTYAKYVRTLKWVHPPSLL